MELPLVMAIELKTTHELIGHVGLSSVNGVIEIGYAIGMDYQGNGYAKEAVKSYVTWGKENLKIHQIYGLVTVGNLSSTKVLESIGFKLEGIDESGNYDEPGKKLIYSS